MTTTAVSDDLYPQDDDELLRQAGLDDQYYSTIEAADLFFDKTDQWMYWGLREDIFVNEKGKKIQPVRVGSGSTRRYTLDVIKEIALASYRRGNISKPRLAAIVRRTIVAKRGGSNEEIKAIVLPSNKGDDNGFEAARGDTGGEKSLLNFVRLSAGVYEAKVDEDLYRIEKDPQREWLWNVFFNPAHGEFEQVDDDKKFDSLKKATVSAERHWRENHPIPVGE